MAQKVPELQRRLLDMACPVHGKVTEVMASPTGGITLNVYCDEQRQRAEQVLADMAS